MAAKLSKRHAQVLAVIVPGMKFGEISQRLKETGLKEGNINDALNNLQAKGLLTRVGEPRQYEYTPTGAPYVIKEGRKIKQQPKSETPDPTLDCAVDVKLSDDQWTYLRNHHRIQPRRALAVRLGLTKLEVNFALIKLEEQRNGT